MKHRSNADQEEPLVHLFVFDPCFIRGVFDSSNRGITKEAASLQPP